MRKRRITCQLPTAGPTARLLRAAADCRPPATEVPHSLGVLAGLAARQRRGINSEGLRAAGGRQGRARAVLVLQWRGEGQAGHGAWADGRRVGGLPVQHPAAAEGFRRAGCGRGLLISVDRCSGAFTSVYGMLV